jgi:hypothetical protein
MLKDRPILKWQGQSKCGGNTSGYGAVGSNLQGLQLPVR